MNLTIALEQRFQMTPDSVVWTPTTFAHAFWSRYLAVIGGILSVLTIEQLFRG
jgi:hypothetical protein